jgi:hypothetical protein
MRGPQTAASPYSQGERLRLTFNLKREEVELALELLSECRRWHRCFCLVSLLIFMVTSVAEIERFHQTAVLITAITPTPLPGPARHPDPAYNAASPVRRSNEAQRPFQGLFLV